MAVDLTLKSTAITNREANPRVLNNPGLGEGAEEKCTYGVIAAIPASLSITSRIRMVSVPSNAVVSAVEVRSAAQTAGKVDIGLYRTNSDGGAVVSAAFFASAVDLASAVAVTNVTNESGTNTIAKQGQPIWQAAGLTSDPKCFLDIVATVVTTDFTTAAGAFSVRARYT